MQPVWTHIRTDIKVGPDLSEMDHLTSCIKKYREYASIGIIMLLSANNLSELEWGRNQNSYLP